MPLRTEVNLPGDLVLDVVAAPPLKGIQPPVFDPLLATNFINLTHLAEG